MLEAKFFRNIPRIGKKFATDGTWISTFIATAEEVFFAKTQGKLKARAR